MKGNSLMEWLVKLVFILMLLPFFISLAFQVLAAIFQAIAGFVLTLLPWLTGLVVLAVGVAALGARATIMRRLPPDTRRELPPRGVQPVRRPRGPGRDDED